MPDGIDLGVSGLASNFDWRSLVDKLADAERTPQRRMLSEQQAIQDRKSAYSSIATELSVLQNRVKDLLDPDLFDARNAASSDSDLATATADPAAALGSYAFHVIQRATASVRLGTLGVAQPLSATSDVSGLVLGNAPFTAPVRAGTFTINGRQISVATTDTLKSVFDRIQTATGGDVTAAYDPATDRITFTSASNTEIVLGTAADTSNFLQIARLSNNGTGTVASSSAVGAALFTAPLTSANLTTAVTDGGAGAGKFKINGVEISYNASTDALSDVLHRINDSSAGVTASYDTVNGRFILTNKATGDLGIALEDVTGNFLAATGLQAGTLQRGKDLLYTINNAGQLSSHSNTITEDSSGIAGLSVSVLDQGDFSIEVTNNTAKTRQAITDFIDEYNRVQGLIETQTASSTDAKGNVTAGTLASESDAAGIAAELRRQVNGTFSLLTGTVKRLEALGISSNGDDDKIALTDAGKLDAALADHLGEVKSLFTQDQTGLASTLNDFLDRTIGDQGSLVAKQDTLQKQVTDLDDQISEQERQVQANRDLLIQSFLAMENAQLQINQQMQFLAQRFGGTSQ
ncbi:MAG TPA: flagellar filament capping protein FliD [Candidatus Saccharimonadales bacterium]|nr:flagellar filament capping protein FliD [Candidatus Saccharimonadales bacterium]